LEGRRDNRSYDLGSTGRQTQVRSQTVPGERISTFRGSTGSGLGRTEVPRIQQINTGNSSFQGGSRGGFGGGGFHR
jgi:hypothetical protein